MKLKNGLTLPTTTHKGKEYLKDSSWPLYRFDIVDAETTTQSVEVVAEVVPTNTDFLLASTWFDGVNAGEHLDAIPTSYSDGGWVRFNWQGDMVLGDAKLLVIGSGRFRLLQAFIYLVLDEERKTR